MQSTEERLCIPEVAEWIEEIGIPEVLIYSAVISAEPGGRSHSATQCPVTLSELGAGPRL